MIIPPDYIEVKDTDTIQKLLYKLMSEFHNICEANSLKYSLDFGSLLGAVRHNAMIPWDDDLDVAMPRNDYDKFIELMREHEFDKLFLYEPSCKNYIYPYAKLALKDTVLYEDLSPKYSCLGLYMDIFPFDGVPDDCEKEKSYRRVERIRKKIGVRSDKITASKIWWKKPYVIVKTIKKLYCSIFPLKYLVNKEIKEVLKTNFYNSDKITYRFSTVKGTKQHEVDKSFFDERILMDFGKGKFWVSANYQERLVNEYGDYMQLPPEEKRVSNHSYKLFVHKELLEF